MTRLKKIEYLNNQTIDKVHIVYSRKFKPVRTIVESIEYDGKKEHYFTNTTEQARAGALIDLLFWDLGGEE